MKRLLLPFLLCVLLVATTFGWDLSLAPGLSVKNALLYLIMAAYMIEMAVYRNLKFELPSVLVPYGLFIAYCLLSWFVASFVIQPAYYEPIETGLSLKAGLLDYFIIFLLFFYGVSSTGETLGLIRVFLWVIVAGNMITVVDAFNIPDLGIIQQREDGRLGGPMGESNQYGALLAFMLPAVIALLWDSKTKKLFAILASFITIVALLAASSRGSFAGLLLGSGFAVFFLRSIISLRQVALGAVISIFGVATTTVAFVSTELFSDLTQRFVESFSGGTFNVTSGRSSIWIAALERMIETPTSFITGFGWDAYDHMGSFKFNTHSAYLNILFNLGLPALLLYLALVYNIFVTCRRAIWKATGVARTYLIAFVFGFASLNASVLFVDLYQPWIYIWACIGLIMRLSIAVSDLSAVESTKQMHATAPSTVSGQY